VCAKLPALISVRILSPFQQRALGLGEVALIPILPGGENRTPRVVVPSSPSTPSG
jgi:hypothetical protein